MRTLATTLLLALLAAGPAHAQLGTTTTASSAADPRVREALDAEGWSYDIDSDDDYRLVVSFQDTDRTQLVYVISQTYTVDGLEIREVWSPVYRPPSGTSEVPPAIAQWALRSAWSLKLGSMAADGQGVVYFVAKVDASASPEVLSKIIRVAASTGDDLEMEKSTGDDL